MIEWIGAVVATVVLAGVVGSRFGRGFVAGSLWAALGCRRRGRRRWRRG